MIEKLQIKPKGRMFDFVIYGQSKRLISRQQENDILEILIQAL